MLSFDATQTAIVASSFKRVSWLFKVEITGTTYYWSTKDITYGDSYTFKIIDFDGITLNRAKSELGIQAPDDLSFSVSNKSNSLSASDFIDKPVTVYLVASDLTNPNTTIATWKYNITRCEPSYQKLFFTCESYINQYLEGDYPNTKRVKDISPSSDPDSNINDNLCVPVPFGTCYIPTRSIYITDQRYYLLGLTTGYTYVISKVHSPKEWGNSSEWDSGSYTFTQSTKTIDTVDWRVFQPIIADSDRDGTVDACGLWLQGNYFLDMPTEFNRDDTKHISGDETGTHDGGNGQASLTDSGASWGVDKLIGFYVVNRTDGSYGKITDNTATNVTAALGGGTINLWHNGDAYTIGGPASVIKFVLEDLGISADDIDDTSFGVAEKTYAGWGLTFIGAFFYHQPRETVLSLLLNMCHSILVTEEGAIKLKVLSKTSQKTLTKSDILNTKEVGEGTFKYSLVTQKQSDSGYVAFQESGEPQDEFVKVIVPAKSTTDNISSSMLNVPFVQDSQDVQRIGTLYYQRKYYQKANISFKSKGTCLALQPDDVITINHADYGGSYDVLIDSIKINADVSMEFKCVEFSVAFDDWSDLSPSAITVATDDSSGTWQPVVSGPDSEQSGSETPNYIPGRLLISNTVNRIILDSDQPMISLDENGTERLRIGNLNGYLGYVADTYGIGIGDATNYLKFDATNGIQLAVSAANGITIYGGADIKLVGSDTDPGEIIWDHGSSKFVRMGSSVTDGRLCIYPYTTNYAKFFIGYDLSGTNYPFTEVFITSQTFASLRALSDTNDYATLSTRSQAVDDARIYLSTSKTGAVCDVYLYVSDLSVRINADILRPDSDNTTNLGFSNKRWKDFYAVTASLSNTGLKLLDTNASHYLIIAPGSDLTADRTLTLTTGDAARTLTINGNPTLNDWFDQAVKVASSPEHKDLKINGATIGTDGVGVIAVKNGTVPASQPADEFQMYAKDIAAGNSAAHFKCEDGNVIKLYQQANIADPIATVASVRTAVIAILDLLENNGLMAST